ncbi:MAG: hypothetical protein SPI72_03060 [Porphyromonas sp.]|nr:hypothetical protein [Porphyromonas sp.]
MDTQRKDVEELFRAALQWIEEEPRQIADLVALQRVALSVAIRCSDCMQQSPVSPGVLTPRGVIATSQSMSEDEESSSMVPGSGGRVFRLKDGLPIVDYYRVCRNIFADDFERLSRFQTEVSAASSLEEALFAVHMLNLAEDDSDGEEIKRAVERYYQSFFATGTLN